MNGFCTDDDPNTLCINDYDFESSSIIKPPDKKNSKLAQKFIFNASNMNLFFAITFLAAGFTGLIFMFFKLSSQKVKIEQKSFFWGIALGIPNYLTLLYFVKSLKSELFSLSCSLR